MRKREVIEKDGVRVDILQLEVLLDIRELLNKTPEPFNSEKVVKQELNKKSGKPRGRPRKERVK